MEDAHHLINALKKDYTVTIDWDATKYIGLTLKRDYKNCKVYAHIPGYLSKALLQFKHQMPKTKQNSLHPHAKPQYGAKAQFVTDKVTSPPQWREGKICQRSSRHLSLLCKGSGQHNPPCTQRNCHWTSKANRENKSNNKTSVRLLRNAGGSSTCIQSKQNDAVHSDAGYCNEEKLRSRAGGTLLPIQRWWIPPQQWCNSYHRNDK